MARQRAIAIRGVVLRGLRAERGVLAIEAGEISDRGSRARSVELPEGWLLAPGFVDLQVNGYGGAEVGDDAEALRHVALSLPAEGVTAFCPTLVSRSERGYRRAAASLNGADGERLAARRLRPHLEGPFLAAERAGAHPLTALRDPEPAVVDRLLAMFRPSIVTLAPELLGGLEAVRRIARAGAIAAVGHTSANAETARRALRAGAHLLTHAPNAMRGIETRDPTALVAFLGHRRARISTIADGVHVDPEVLALLARLAGPRLVLVSDAAPAAAAAGTYRLGGRTIRSDGRRLTTDDGVLAGSARGLSEGPATLAQAGIARARAVAAASVAPRRLLGLPWRLRPGEPADLTILDGDLAPQLTVIGGEAAYCGPALPDAVRAAWP